MAVLPFKAPNTKNNDGVDIFDDITHSLTSLQFESALTGEERELMHLRQRCHALTAHACAHGTYFVSMISEARLIKTQLEKPKVTKTNQLLQESETSNPVIVGIIGCGRLGSHLAHCLLSVGEVSSENLRIATRRPETLTELQERGVSCSDQNAEVAKCCDILFICVLPCQFPSLVHDLKGNIRKETVVYSFIPTLPLVKMSSLLGVVNIVRPSYDWNNGIQWDYSMDITAAFHNDVILEQMCPLSFNSKESLIFVNPKFSEQLVYSFLNVCSLMGVRCQDAIDMVNAVILGHSARTPLSTKLELIDFTNQVRDTEKPFPLFDISAMEDSDTPLTTRLRRDPYIRTRFVEKFCQVFKNYFQWKNAQLGKFIARH